VSRQWFRMYAEAVDDEKLRLLAFEDRWHFVAILCLKAMGTLDSEAPHLERRIGLKLGLQLPQLDELKRRLLDVRLIDDNWQPIKWDERQYESDISTGRVRKFREKRQGNVSETDQNRAEQSRTDTEQNRTEGAEAPTDLDAAAFARWQDYRKQIRKPLKPASIPAAQRALAAFGSEQAAVVEQSIANGWQGLFPLKTSGADNAGKSRKTRYEQLYGS
jgi:hypothetical protein